MTNLEQELYDALVDKYGYDEEEAQEIIDSGNFGDYENYAEYGESVFLDYGISIDGAPNTYVRDAVEESIDWDNFGRAMANYAGNLDEIVETDYHIFAIWE